MIKKEEKPDFVKWFSELDKNSGSVAGGKGANLAEIYNLKLPVPPGFVVTAQAYDYFIKKAGVKEKIKEILEKIDYENTEQLDNSTKEIRELIMGSKIPKEMEIEILESYEHLNVKKTSGTALDILKSEPESIFVAVRSSATAEDLATASFAGQQDSFVNIKGNFQLLGHIKKCFASLFTSRATYYRNKKGFRHEEVSLAVVVQKMVDADKSGVIFSKDPSYKNNNTIIEAVFGLGEGIVSGQISPDKYVVTDELEILDKKIADKKIAITKDSEGMKIIVKLKDEKSKSQVLSDYEIKKLTEYGLKLEEHYKKPQDIEFTIEEDKIYIVQTRAITTIDSRLENIKEIKGEVILSGIAASPGIAFGKVKIINKLEDLKKISQGDVLVTKMTNPDMVVTMQKSAAIVTDEGGMTAHASIVSREMGIPCFSGDTLVLTNEGFMSLSEVNMKISQGIELYTLSFNIKDLKVEWKRILNSNKRTSKTITISISKNGKVNWNTLNTTPEHKFFNLNNRTPCYKEITKIINNKGVTYTINKIPPFNLSNNFGKNKAYICGAIFSDGYLRIQKDGTSSTVFVQKTTPQKMNFINEVCKNFEDVYEYPLRLVKPNSYYCYKKNITLDLMNQYENLIKIVLNCQQNSLIKYLSSVIDGDGNFIKRGNVIKISLDARDTNLLNSLTISCMRLGLNYRIRKEDNEFRFYIISGLDKIKPHLKRIVLEDIKKATGDTYFSSKELFGDISISGRKGIKSFVKNNCLISEREILEKVIPFINEENKEFLLKLINSDMGVMRVKKISENASENVFNIEVEDNNNYIVFTKFFTPIIVKNCVVGTQEATARLKDNEIITVNGFDGKIYRGKVSETIQKEILPVIETKTKIKVIVDLPTYAERAAESKIDSVGLMRIEGIIAESGKHPNYFIEKNSVDEYEEIIFMGINGIAKYFDEIWVRTSDIRSDEFANLEGAPKETEANPMLGMHGIRAGLKNTEILKAELNAMKRISEKGKKIGILMPQIISVEEVQKVKKILWEIDFKNAKLGVMIETPASVEIIKELCEEKIDFISFGTNDLTQYTLAIDRGNESVQYLYDEMHPAILHQLEHVIKICKKFGVETSICGQAGSEKKMVEFLVENGIDSISVNADVAYEISKFVAELENELASNSGDDKIVNEDNSERFIDKVEQLQDKDNAEPSILENKKESKEEITESDTSKDKLINEKDDNLIKSSVAPNLSNHEITDNGISEQSEAIEDNTPPQNEELTNKEISSEQGERDKLEPQGEVLDIF